MRFFSFFEILVSRFSVFLAVFGLAMTSEVAVAHHSVGGTYDQTKYVEIEGVIDEVRWRNPHVQIDILVKNDEGGDEIWKIEMASISTLRRRGLKTGFMDKGDNIRVYGLGAWRNPLQILGRNLLLNNSKEIILSAHDPAHWTDPSVSATRDLNAGRMGESSAPELGIFKVWSLPTNQGGGSFWNKDYPLTKSALASHEGYDLKAADVVVGCEAKGMPTIMSQPYPIQFLKDGDNIVLKLEESDTVRPINMSPNKLVDRPLNKVGYSSGYWDAKTLVVTTTDIGWTSFNGRGIPLGQGAKLVERFTPTEDGSQLDYTMTITDSATFTEPVVLTRFWHFYSDATLDPYNCEY